METLDLTKNEAKVYSTLIKGIEIDPLKIAKATELPRPRVYEVLSSLAAKNLLDKQSNGYRLLPPKESIPLIKRNLDKEHQQRVATIEEFGSYLHNVWQDNLASDISPGVEILSLENAQSLFIDHLQNVRDRVLIAIAEEDTSIDMRKSGATLASSYHEKMEVRYLISEEKLANRVQNAFTHFKPFSDLKIKIKTNNNLHSSFVILDNIIYIFFFTSTESLKASVLRTASKQLVNSFNWMFNALWDEC